MKASKALFMAQTARTLEGEYKRKETNDLLIKISIQAKVGNMGMYVYDPIDPIIVNRLKELGYKVSESDCQREGYTAEITWG